MFSYALKEIRRRRLRTFANVSGYVIAVAFLIIAVSLAQAYVVVANGALEGIGTHFAAYIPASNVCPCQLAEVGPYFKNVYTPTFNSSLVESVKRLPGVAEAAPCLVFRFENLTICGIDPNSLATKTTVVSSDEILAGKGRYLQTNDTNQVMVDEIFANVNNLKVGDTLNAFEHKFIIVGIVNPSLHSKPAGTANIYAPLKTVQNIASYYGDLYNFAVKDINLVLVEISAKGDSSYIGAVQKSVLDTIESYGARPGAVVGYKCGLVAREVVSINEVNAWTISAVLLVSVVLFSLKSQFGTIIERTKEIGILKAIGWTDGDITKQILLESLLQAVAGGVIGIIIGSITVLLFPQFFASDQNLQIAISLTLVTLGMLASIIGGAIAGIIPAWRAVKLQPADALRRY
jgi:putative ABC transport system permease protein